MTAGESIVTRKVILFFIGFAITSDALWSADRAPARQVVYSSNSKYAAESDVKSGSVKVYRVYSGGEKTLLWELPSLEASFHISEDGEVLAVAGVESDRVILSELSKEALRDASVVKFYSRDLQVVSVSLERVIHDAKKLKKVDRKEDRGEYLWGYIRGFDEDNRYVLDTLDRHRIWIDPKTGQIIRDEDNNAKSNEGGASSARSNKVDRSSGRR